MACVGCPLARRVWSCADARVRGAVPGGGIRGARRPAAAHATYPPHAADGCRRSIRGQYAIALVSAVVLVRPSIGNGAGDTPARGFCFATLREVRISLVVFHAHAAWLAPLPCPPEMQCAAAQFVPTSIICGLSGVGMREQWARGEPGSLAVFIGDIKTAQPATAPRMCAWSPARRGPIPPAAWPCKGPTSWDMGKQGGPGPPLNNATAHAPLSTTRRSRGSRTKHVRSPPVAATQPPPAQLAPPGALGTRKCVHSCMSTEPPFVHKLAHCAVHCCVADGCSAASYPMDLMDPADGDPLVHPEYVLELVW